MNFKNLPVNWFDLVVVAVLIVGFTRGRKNGMSEELMITLEWLGIVFAGAFLYRRLGDMMAASTPISHLTCYITVYIALGVAVKIISGLIKKAMGGKVVSPDRFGKGEYYLGMLSGALRYACILVAVLALLNAPYYSESEIAAKTKRDKDVYGESFFPSISSIQQQVFGASLSGSVLKRKAGFMLISSTMPEKKQLGGGRKIRDDMPPGL
jgi:uncharacterized membrane protein required for colicin V production